MKKSILSNTSTNIFLFAIKFVISFFTRKLLITYLGIEILGINSVIVETIQMISLLELGIQSAVIFRLYSPIAEDNIELENKIYNVLVISYRIIGSLVFSIGLIISPIIYSICNTELPKSTVYIIYFIQLAIATVNYFVTCPRIIMLVHQKQFLCNGIDCLTITFILVLQIISIVVFKNYYLFILCSFIQINISNLIIYFYTKKAFKEVIKKHAFDRLTFNVVLRDLKHIIIGKMATFIYASTDNMVISVFCGSVTVGMISNYKLITNALRSLCESYHAALTPILGNIFALDKTEIKVKEVMTIYTIFQYFVSCAILIPLYSLINDVIHLWLGQEFEIANSLILLMIMDNFMNNMEQPCVLISSCFGYFEEDKWVSGIAAITNISMSIILAGKFGANGVLIGTIIAMTIFWGGRSYYVFKNTYKSFKQLLLKYWLSILSLTIVFIIQLELFRYISRTVVIQNKIVALFVQALIIECIILLVFFIIFLKIPITRKYVMNFYYRIIRRGKNE